MNWLDFAIIFVLIGFVAAAYAAGLIREAVTLVAAILGIIIAGLLYDDLAADILVFMDDEDAAQAISFLILAGALYLFGQILPLMLRRTASLLMLGCATQPAGAVFASLSEALAVKALPVVL